MLEQNSSLLFPGSVSHCLQQATLDRLKNSGGGHIGHVVVRTCGCSIAGGTRAETRCHQLVLISERRELPVDTAAEYSYGRHAQGPRNVHWTTVIADQKDASREERYHLSQFYPGRYDVIDVGDRGTIPLRIDERQYVDVRPGPEIAGHIGEALDRPTLLCYARAGMDCHQEIGRVGAVRSQEFGRPKLLTAGHPETWDLDLPGPSERL